MNKITCMYPNKQYEVFFDENKAFCKEKKDAYFFINENILYLVWLGGKVEIFTNEKDSLVQSKNIKYKMLTSDKIMDNLKELYTKSVENRLIIDNTQNNLYNLWVINLEKRIDRMEIIEESMKNQNVFNINYFKAYQHRLGYYGCSLSHLALISYAKSNELPYIIVAEDDNDIQNIDKLKEIIDELSSRDDWDIFNGSPSFYDIMYRKVKPIFTKMSKTDKLVYSNWGQTTNFMIYNKSSYDKMLKYSFDNHIDQYISENFLQVIYKDEYLNKQRPSLSDIYVTGKVSDFSNLYKRFEQLMKKTPVI